MARPFQDVVVLDLTHVIAGPFATHQLAVLGAEVIKIEPPGQPDCARGRGPDAEMNAAGLGLTYQVQGAGKQSLALDLAREEGRAILLQLTARADVLVSNYRPGGLDDLGLGLERLRSANPKLITCGITGFPANGATPGRRAYDNVVQAASGIIAQSGGVKPGLSFIDYATGWSAAFAISAALLQRRLDGKPQHIECAMFDAALMMMGPELAALLHADESGRPAPRRREPGLLTYPTADGALTLGAFTPKQMRKLCAALSGDGYAAPEADAIVDFASLWSSAAEIEPKLRSIFLTRTASAWEEWLASKDLPGARVRSLEEVASDPALAASGLLQRAPGEGQPLLPTAPFRFEREGPRLDRPAPSLGEDTEALLARLGYSSADRVRLRRERVVA